LNYGISEKECLAVVWGIAQFRVYVFGTKFTVETDNIALMDLRNLNNPTGRFARWIMSLQVYDFDIVYRKGNSNNAADALSRLNPEIVLILTRAQQAEESTKNLDVYEDSQLIEYLLYGRHLPGITHAQVKRVEKLAKVYRVKAQDKESEKLVFEFCKNNKWLRVPRIENRAALIEQAHLLGHFRAESTVNRLLENYYWKKMYESVENVLKTCEGCHRNQIVPEERHPAKATEILHIHDRFGIDLVFGLPESKEGFKGLVVITEYLTKFPFIAAIKSKSAEEIANHVLTYIGIFGAPGSFAPAVLARNLLATSAAWLQLPQHTASSRSRSSSHSWV
jgi:hypothetical protein